MAKPLIAVVVGSNRTGSINRKLAEAIMKLGSNKLQFEFALIDDLPLYNFDLEKDWPATAKRFSSQISQADGALIVTPEHNRSLPVVLKNAIDWGSRASSPSVWHDKPLAITGAARGAIGTAMVQQHLRQILGNLGATVMGGEAYIGGFVQTSSITMELSRSKRPARSCKLISIASRPLWLAFLIKKTPPFDDLYNRHASFGTPPRIVVGRQPDAQRSS